MLDWQKEMRSLGMEAFARQNYVVAAKVLAKYVQTAAPDAEAMAAWGLALGALGMQGASLKVFDYLVKQFPKSSSAHYHRGIALEKAGNPKEAVAAYCKTLECRPKHRLALKRLQELAPEKIISGSIQAAEAALPLTRTYSKSELSMPVSEPLPETAKEPSELPLSRHLLKRLVDSAPSINLDKHSSSGTVDLLPTS